MWAPEAAIASEILWPGDESWEKFDHDAAHRVPEIFVIDPDAEAVHIFVRSDDDTDFSMAESSPLLDVAADELAVRLDW